MYYRTIFISDFHLGSRSSSAGALLDFLRHNDCDHLYLVGDIIDLWQLRKTHYWPQSHNDVVQKLLRKARKGTTITLIPGNHDEFLINCLGAFGNVAIKASAIHTTATKQQVLVVHGHEFDIVTQHATWIAKAGDVGYNFALRLNRYINWVRRHFGWHDWSLSAYLKTHCKQAVSFISNFEQSVTHYAKVNGVTGIICGHIHSATIRQIGTITYYNCGDWVESNTALVEQMDGKIELVHWKIDSDQAGC